MVVAKFKDNIFLGNEEIFRKTLVEAQASYPISSITLFEVNDLNKRYKLVNEIVEVDNAPIVLDLIPDFSHIMENISEYNMEKNLIDTLKLIRDYTKASILGVRNTFEQIEAYDLKYETALEVKAGTSTKYTVAEADAIILQHEMFKSNYKEVSNLLDDLRIYIKDNFITPTPIFDTFKTKLFETMQIKVVLNQYGLIDTLDLSIKVNSIMGV